MSTITLTDAQAKLPQLLDRAAAGEEIIIAEAGQPVARLVSIAARPLPKAPRALGLLKGQVTIGPDFDDPLPEDMMRAFE